MSKKIDEVYTDDPSASNDPSVDYKFASTNGTTDEVALNMDQLANSVAVRVGTSQPPNPTEDLNQFTVSFLENTLIGNIHAVTGVDYTHWLINVDDETTPTNLPTAIDPGDFEEGPIPALKSVAAIPASPTEADWSSEEWFPWVYDLPTTTLKALNNRDKTFGTVVSPIDSRVDTVGTLEVTTAATFADSSATGITDATTEIAYKFNDQEDLGSGLDSASYEVWNENTQLPVVLGAGNSGLITNLLPNTLYSFTGRVFDNYGNEDFTPPEEAATDSSGSEGVLEFSDTGFPAITHAEPSAGSNTLTVTVTLTGRTGSELTDTKGVTVGFWAWTSLGSGQVEAIGSWNPVNGVLSFGSGVTSQDLVIDITGVSSASNVMFELYLTSPTAVGFTPPTIGANKIIAVYLTGDGTASSGTSYLPNADYPSAGHQHFVLDTDLTMIRTQGSAGEDYVDIAEGSAPVDDSVINGVNSPNNYIHGDLSSGGYTLDATYYDTPSGRIELDIEVPADANYYTWVRNMRTAANKTFYCGFDGNEGDYSKEFGSCNHSTNIWDFSPLCDKSVSLDTPIARFLTAGTHRFYLCFREISTSLYHNRIEITTDPTYDPSAAGTGPNIVAKATLPISVLDTTNTPATDDPNNPATQQELIGEIPATTLQATLFPANGATDVPDLTTLSFSFPGSTGLVFNGANITVTADGGNVSGVWQSDFVNAAIFVDSNGAPIKFPAGASIAVTGSDIGVIIDGADGIKDEVIFGTWAFTIIDTGTSPILVDVNFSNHNEGPYTQQMLFSDFDVLSPGGYGTNVDNLAITTDADATRGKVLQYTHPAGVTGSGVQIQNVFDPDNTMIRYPDITERFPNSLSAIWDLTGNPPVISEFQTRNTRRTAGTEKAYDTIYCMFDFKLSANWYFPQGSKFMGLSSGDALTSTHNGPAFPEGVYGTSWRFLQQGNAAYSKIPVGQGALSFYLYDAGVVQKHMFLDLVNGDVDDNHYRPQNMPASDIYLMSRNKWIRVWQKVSLNTAINVPSGGPSGNGMPTIDGTVIESAYNSSARCTSEGNLADGTVEIWVQEEDWPVPIKMLTFSSRWRWTDYLKIDGFYLQNKYNAANVDAPPANQQIWFDNIRIDNADFGFPA